MFPLILALACLGLALWALLKLIGLLSRRRDDT